MLKNRFPNKVFTAWNDWYYCLECGENTGDALHHIISPSNKHYVKGYHNKSVLNSALLCNFKCHLYNPELHKEYKTKEYLTKTFMIMNEKKYDFDEIDLEFLTTYKHLYERELSKLN
jgi:hypothetical protein